MKKTLALIALLGTATLAQAGDGWTFLPILNDPSLKLEPTLALSVDRLDPRTGGVSAGTATGLELNFNCGLIQSPGNRIRTALKLHRFSETGLKATTMELSPRYTVPLAQGLALGAGPSLAAARVRAGGRDATQWGAGLALGLDWRAGALYAGADLRWHDMRQKAGVDVDHTSIGLKLGVNF